ncbi:MAG: hypothetical protein JNL14_14330 [Devosia sp.]|uniref:hypothetical protein n=1 Tax=Devosia sp. TaxID=1871048 RepID=UPI001A5EEFE8|nr:hypothetical protein [Devosia sp.]MBL8598908.1 hypothetical protein [Devosia sp.]
MHNESERGSGEHGGNWIAGEVGGKCLDGFEATEQFNAGIAALLMDPDDDGWGR